MNTQRNDDSPVDLKPFLENSILHRTAEWLTNNIFQPIDNFIEWLDTRFTKKLVEDDLKNG